METVGNPEIIAASCDYIDVVCNLKWMKYIAVVLFCSLLTLTFGNNLVSINDYSSIDTLKGVDSLFINDCCFEYPPAYKGGKDSLFSYFDRNFNYPIELKDSLIKGTFRVSFVVDTLGKVENCSIIQGLHPLLDKEVLRVINTLTEWIPATCPDKKKKVRFGLVMPVEFK